MKTKHIDLSWLAMVIILSAMILFSGCSTSRQVQKDSNLVKIDCTAVEKQVVKNDITIDTKTLVTASTETTETIDTIVNVPDPKTNVFFQVPVRMKRVIKRQEFSSTRETKKDNSQSTTTKDVSEKKTVLNESKKVISKRANFTLYAVIAASVLLLLLFVFLWKRNLLSRFFDLFR